MEFTTQIVNISKIKEGFYIGDRTTGLNLDLIIQFKITHMINASGNRLINAFETIGIKYLTLHWTESANQSLFDPKDNIADIIVSFIDDALKNGEGLLGHSVRGQNRICIVVIIYLIKKYNWALMKCFDFLRSKKEDVDIPKYFLTQLSQFESRLSKEGISHSQGWSDDGTVHDNDEKIMRNTYVNGLLRKENNTSPSSYQLGKRKERQKIGWGDCNPYNTTDMLIQPNRKQDLLIQKDIKQITNHMKFLPSKSSIKRSKSNLDYCRNNSNYTANTSVNTNLNSASFLKIQETNKNSTYSQFNRNTSPLKKTNSFNGSDSGGNTSKERFIHFNHYYGQDGGNNCGSNNNNENTFEKRNNSFTNKNRNMLKNIINTPNDSNMDIGQGYNKDSLLKKDSLNKKKVLAHKSKKGANNFLVGINNNNNSVNNNNNTSYQSIKKDKENKLSVSEDQKVMKNNFIENYNYAYTGIDNTNLLRVIDSSGTPTNHMLNSYVKTSNQKKNQMSLPLSLNSNYQPKIIKLRDENHKNPHFIISQNKPLNNFDPALIRKNQNMFNRPRSGTNHQMPITLPKDLIAKPLTPDHTFYHSFKPEKPKPKPKIQSNYLYGSIQRKTPHAQNKDISDPMIIRPSTAPQKDKPNQKAKQYQANGQSPFVYPGLIRLPSPMNKCKGTYQPIIYPQQKYERAPSPMIKSAFAQQYNNISLIK